MFFLLSIDIITESSGGRGPDTKSYAWEAVEFQQSGDLECAGLCPFVISVKGVFRTKLCLREVGGVTVLHT